MIDMDNLARALDSFHSGEPFSHCVVDGFFEPEWARRLEAEFPDYDSDKWYVYDNAIEHKRALNNWNLYPEATYRTLAYLSGHAFASDLLGGSLGIDLVPDPGLHGGGWHMHGAGGNLNPHLDYHTHPKMGMVRKLNLIVYLSSALDPSRHDGHLGLWRHDPNSGGPGELAKEVAPEFNRAILFDTTQNSWHGMSRRLSVPQDVHRKSLAVYYLIQASEADRGRRQRALFAPHEDQKGDADVEALILKRADVNASRDVYRSPSGSKR